MPGMTVRAWALFALVSVLWGVPYLLIGIALRDGVGPLWTAAARVAIAAVVLAPVVLRRRARVALRGRAGRLAVLALVEVAVPFTLIPLGERTVASGPAGVLIATEPMFVLLAGLLLGGGRRPGAVRVVGLAVGFAGVVVLMGVHGVGPGLPLILAAAASYGLGAVLVERWFADVGPVVVVAGVLLLAAPLLAVPAVVTEPLPAPSAAGVAAVLALGLGSTAAGLVSFFALVVRAGADRAALITYVAPVVAVVGGAVVLGEPVGWRVVGGTGLVLAGAWLATRVTDRPGPGMRCCPGRRDRC